MENVIAARIKEIRQARGLSKRQLARIIGCQHVHVVYWENGTYTPSSKYWPRIQEWMSGKETYHNGKLTYHLKTQHPASDGDFMTVSGVFVQCSQAHGGCECPVLYECQKLFSTISDRCSDRPLTAAEAHEYEARLFELLKTRVVE